MIQMLRQPSTPAPVEEISVKRHRKTRSSSRDPLRDLAAGTAQNRATTAEMLAYLAEFDARGLYLSAGYVSMFAYCVGELGHCEEPALKRVLAALMARRFPGILDALAEGRLNLESVLMLAPYLTPETANELLDAATHKSESELQQLLAERFPSSYEPA